MRVRENLRQLLSPGSFLPSSANGVPIHLPKWERSARAGRAQSASLLTHALVIGALALVAMHPPGPSSQPFTPGEKNLSNLSVSSSLLDRLRGLHPSDGSGNGSGHSLLSVTQGNLPARSSIQIVKPMLPQNPNPEIPIPPTILDPSAPRVLPPVNNIGLPWMPDRNDSSGRGHGDTIGDGTGDSMGNAPGDGVGQGTKAGIYQPGVTLPTCAYCADPHNTRTKRAKPGYRAR